MGTSSLFGILNITEDSFSDGGKYLAPEAALAHARAMLANGADVLDIGAASSNPDAKPVASDIEIARMAPVVAALKRDRAKISIDSFSHRVQLWALAQGADYLNDIQGFADPTIYPALAGSRARLIVMHSVQEWGPATRVEIPPAEIYGRVCEFFRARIAALTEAGVARERLILDPGMGFFLGANADASFTILRRLSELKREFALPLLVSVSRKSFLRKITGRPPAETGPASLAAELFAVAQGADHIRTHDPGALADALAVRRVLDSGPSQA